ncbi:hypothetical protein MTO96_031595 [Rhipicephalus appendiculatus]
MESAAPEQFTMARASVNVYHERTKTIDNVVGAQHIHTKRIATYGALYMTSCTYNLYATTRSSAFGSASGSSRRVFRVPLIIYRLHLRVPKLEPATCDAISIYKPISFDVCTRQTAGRLSPVILGALS